MESKDSSVTRTLCLSPTWKIKDKSDDLENKNSELHSEESFNHKQTHLAEIIKLSQEILCQQETMAEKALAQTIHRGKGQN